MQVTFNPDGDSQGRQDFANKVSDFSVTADGFQGFDSTTGVSDTSNGRPYAYLPVAAGGTSFPYQIKFDGTQVENLRLSGQTLAKIFTNQITNWDDPEITKDNNGVALPSIPIVPVVQSEGSGATQQLTDYFATEYPSIWDPFAGQSGPTEYFPRQGDQIAQNGSTGAMNYIASSAANGSIGYVEYSYPLSVGYPVAKVLNSGGFYTLPTQYNVAIALEQAQINMDPNSPNYLLQTLTNVYTDPDPRTYPLSSYVYMIEPTGGTGASTNDPNETSGKRQSIADSSTTLICQGQSQIGAIGYSPLPVNLVQAAFSQVQKLQQADPNVDLTNLNIQTCNEPTFVPGQPNTNYLTTIAPQPPACDQQGAGRARRASRRTASGPRRRCREAIPAPTRARRGARPAARRGLRRRTAEAVRPERAALPGSRRPLPPQPPQPPPPHSAPLRSRRHAPTVGLRPPPGSRALLRGMDRRVGRARPHGGLCRSHRRRLPPVAPASAGQPVRRAVPLAGVLLAACVTLVGLSSIVPAAAAASHASSAPPSRRPSPSRAAFSPEARRQRSTPGPSRSMSARPPTSRGVRKSASHRPARTPQVTSLPTRTPRRGSTRSIPSCCSSVGVQPSRGVAGHPGDLLDARCELALPGRVADEPYQLDQYSSQPGADVVGEPSSLPSAAQDPYCQTNETGGAGTPVRYWVPWAAADGTVYDGGVAGFCGEPPEATNGETAALPSNETYGVTGLDGTGSDEFDVFDSTENATLGCSASVACSLVAVPIMGVSCDADVVPAPSAADLATCESPGDAAAGALATGQIGSFPYALSVSGGLWWTPSNWRNHITVPLTFAPTASSCPIVSSNNTADVYGSELLLQATSQWEPYFCLGDGNQTFTFDHVAEGEPEARNGVATGTVAAAFTSYAQPLGYGKPVVNAPVAVTGFTISFSIDGTDGDPIATLKLTPLLLAKLLTSSYSVLSQGEADPELQGNPLNITSDPEFEALDPGIPVLGVGHFAAAELISLGELGRDRGTHYLYQR